MQLLLLSAALTLGGCSLFEHQRSPPPIAANATNAEQEAECERLRESMRTAQQHQQRAPTLSADHNIVSAAQAKADNTLQDLQDRYDAQNCAAAALPPRAKTPPLPPAPGAGGVLQ